MSGLRTILIVGGYGVFGSRIAALLENEPRLTLIIAGRSRVKAEAFCRTRVNAKAKLIAAAFDRDDDVESEIAALRPDLLVDASGPFQAYGEGRYRLPEACLATGVNYLDLADASDFVAGIRRYDDAARAAGLYLVAGASSFPVLTASVVRRLARGAMRLDAIRAGIAPSPFAGVGENVIRAIASYAGRKISLRRGGETTIAHPFTESMRFTIAPPGAPPLRNTLFSLVDVPDLWVLAELWPQANTIWMGAGPVPEIFHRLLIALAWLVRLNAVPTLSPLAQLMHVVTNHLRWGEHRGGLFVEIEGLDAAGAKIARSWNMLAEGDDGPLIPSMAVAALVHRALDGLAPPPGARSAVSDLELEDYEKLFAARAIRTGIRDKNRPEGKSLYARILGSARDDLPGPIRHMHDIQEIASAKGRASVARGEGLLARLAARLIGFPEAAEDTPVSVAFAVSGGEEIWTRTFGAKSFSSRQFAGRGRSEGLLCERFGPLAFAMALVSEKGRLSLVLRRWSAFGLPLPLWLAPRSNAYESAEDGRFHFHVEIGHPLTGLIVRYRGWLER
jgi:Domain of unknown function (DUF4166)/Saccharopine dehydrogenase NADP binding domain